MGTAPLSSRTQLKGNEDELDPTCAAATLKLIRDKLPKLPPPQARLSLFRPCRNLLLLLVFISNESTQKSTHELDKLLRLSWLHFEVTILLPRCTFTA